MVVTRVRTDGGDLIVETDNGTVEEINAVVREVYDALNPRVVPCAEAHLTDEWHPQGHPTNQLISLDLVERRP